MSRQMLIAYDISSHTSRRKVSNMLEKIGVRINKSVFVCRIGSLNEAMALTQKLKPFLGKRDRVCLFPLCRHCYGKAWIIDSVRTFQRTKRQLRTKVIGGK